MTRARFCLSCEKTTEDVICSVHGMPTISGDFFEPGAEPIEPGRVLGGRYRVTGLLGKGGNASVYAATQLGLGRSVAAKVFRAERIEDARKLMRFYREAQALLRLSHPNIVPMIDFGVDDATRSAFLVMERLEGCTLAELVDERGPLAAPRAVELSRQLSRALVEAHRAEVVHRDLKPANLIVQTLRDGSDLLRVVDFGLARLSAEGPQLTTPGTLLGSPKYMSPEQVRREPTTSAADVYGFGCILHFILTASPPFQAASLAELLNAHLFANPPELPRSVDASLEPPGALGQLVRSCLAKSPGDRPSMDEISRALDRLVIDPTATAESDAHEPTITRVTEPGQTRVTELAFASAESSVVTEPGLDRDVTGSPTQVDRPLQKPRTELAEPARRSAWPAALALAALAVLAGFIVLLKSASRVPAPAETAVETPIEPVLAAAQPAPPPPKILLESDPSGAEVVRGGQLLGRTPLSISRELGESESVVIRAPGREPKALTANDLADREQLTVTLEATVEPRPLPTKRASKAKGPGKRPEAESYPVW